MTRLSVRAWLVALFATVPLLLLTARASGQDPALEVFYHKLEPKEQFKYKWKDQDGKWNEGVCTAGVFRWEVPRKGDTEFGTNGLDRNFTGYCAEILVPIVAEKTYRFRINSLYEVRNYDKLVGREDAAQAAQRRVIYIKELFGLYFRDPTLRAVDPVEAIALQVALWEVIQETEPANGPPTWDLFAGDFQADYAKDVAPAYVLKAQEFLTSLKGDDAVFYTNPDLRGRELIRLQGIANAENVVAQSQFALRYVGGGGAGTAGLTRAAVGGGFAPLGGGAPGGGVGTGGSGGGLLFPGGGGLPGGATTTPPVTTTTTPPTTPPNVPPIGNPPPPQPPNTPPTPIPVPAGLLLGAIALGTIGSWRLGARILAKKQ